MLLRIASISQIKVQNPLFYSMLLQSVIFFLLLCIPFQVTGEIPLFPTGVSSTVINGSGP